MYNLYVVHEPDNWGDCIPYQVLSALSQHWAEYSKLWEWFRVHGHRFDHRLTSYDILRTIGLYMPRKGKQNDNTGNTGGNRNFGQSSGNEWKWANIELSSADIDILTNSNTTLEYLAGCIAVLANDGIGVTIKPVDSGKSVCVTIYRPDFQGNGYTVGISSFGGNVRDALLVTLYKLDEKLGGEFNNAVEYVQAIPPKSRFR